VSTNMRVLAQWMKNEHPLLRTPYGAGHAKQRRTAYDEVGVVRPPEKAPAQHRNGYKHIPGMLAWRVSTLFRRRLWPTPVCPVTDVSEIRKQAAIACYPTQLRAREDDWAIGAKLAAPAPEQFWRLAPRPVGWERIAAD